jgi:threonine/homoserine/homoserine lactone efflux protein
MHFDTWAWFAITETILCLTPGPAVLLVLATALRRGALPSLASTCGILAANTAYFAVSATGLGAVILTSHELFFAIKWLGAAYLIWLGLNAFFAKRGSIATAPATIRAAAPRRLFVDGFVLQAANPKALIFFTALLPQFIDPTGSLPLQVAILGTTSVVIEFVVLAVYGALAGRASRLASKPRFALAANRIAGGLLVGAGIRLAAIKNG